MTDEQLAYSLARAIAEHELRRMGLREEERGLSVASLTYSYLELARQLLATMRAADSEETPGTEDALVHTMATVASSSRRIAATMRRTLVDLGRDDPRRHGLNEAAIGLDGVSEALETALERAGVELAA